MCAKGGAGTTASLTGIASGRVQRHRDGENDEIKLYLSKLRELVPFMPKNRKLSKLEVIQNVIDYICELQNALDAHPDVNGFDPLVALQHHQHHQHEARLAMEIVPEGGPVVASRQPLGVLAARNTILATGGTVSGSNLNASGDDGQQLPW